MDNTKQYDLDTSRLTPENKQRFEAKERFVARILDNLKPDADKETILILIDMHLAAEREAGLKDAEYVVRSVANKTTGEKQRTATVLADNLLKLIKLNQQGPNLSYGYPEIKS